MKRIVSDGNCISSGPDHHSSTGNGVQEGQENPSQFKSAGTSSTVKEQDKLVHFIKEINVGIGLYCGHSASSIGEGGEVGNIRELRKKIYWEGNELGGRLISLLNKVKVITGDMRKQGIQPGTEAIKCSRENYGQALGSQ